MVPLDRVAAAWAHVAEATAGGTLRKRLSLEGLWRWSGLSFFLVLGWQHLAGMLLCGRDIAALEVALPHSGGPFLAFANILDRLDVFKWLTDDHRTLPISVLTCFFRPLCSAAHDWSLRFPASTCL